MACCWLTIAAIPVAITRPQRCGPAAHTGQDRLSRMDSSSMQSSTNSTFAGRTKPTARPPRTSSQWLLENGLEHHDNHILEFTALSDKRKIETDYFDTLTDADDSRTHAWHVSWHRLPRGSVARAYIAKYTGYPDRQLHPVGAGRSQRVGASNYSITAAGIPNEYNGGVGQPPAGCPVIVDARPSAVSGLITPCTGCTASPTCWAVRTRRTAVTRYRIDH